MTDIEEGGGIHAWRLRLCEQVRNDKAGRQMDNTITRPFQSQLTRHSCVSDTVHSKDNRGSWTFVSRSTAERVSQDTLEETRLNVNTHTM